MRWSETAQDGRHTGPFVMGQWFVVRAPLRDGRQCQGRSGNGLNVLVVDDRVPEHGLELIVAEADAWLSGDYDQAPHCSRPQPNLSIVH